MALKKARPILAMLLTPLICLVAGSSTEPAVGSQEQPSRMNHHVTAQSAAKRALCLASLVLRAQAEYQLHPDPGDQPSPNGPVAQDFAVSQLAWIKREGLW